MSGNVIALFDGTFDGFLCIVYEHFYNKITPILIQEIGREQPSLTDEFYRIETDSSHAARVFKGIGDKISNEAADRIYRAFLSGEDDKNMTIFRYILLGFKVGKLLDNHLKEDCVRGVHQLAKRVGGEAHLLKGFSRFVETDSGVMYCEITPKNDVLEMVASHFTRRLMNLKWVIHDKRRGKAAIYDTESVIVADVPNDISINYAEGEAEIQELWVAFFHSLSIKARENPKLQRQMLPLYFRKNMTEFQHGLKAVKARASQRKITNSEQGTEATTIGLPENVME